VLADPRVRPASSTDREALLGLWLDLVLHHRRLDPDYPSLPGIREALLAELERGLGSAGCQIWLAELDGTPVGFLFAEVAGPEGPASGGGPGWIHELYVEPDWRRRGLGRALVDEASAFFDERGQSRFSVRVESANQEGLHFWRELGLEERARILEKRP
jgi:ribosomal protein S18 acetylase RimI-like enzyme